MITVSENPKSVVGKLEIQNSENSWKMVMDLTKQKSKFVLLLYVCLEKINTGIGI
jgi:hypothetical protein